MNVENKYVRFDWAVKRMLRDKANFGVLEGLITVLLEQPVKIVEILESEGNQDAADDKFNRVDVKAKTSAGDIIIVEIQLSRHIYYLQRILYGVAKAVTEHINLGEKYNEVKKVYSISIVYFDLGQGSDYLYHGINTFVGVHTHDTLRVNVKEDDMIRMKTPEEVFPEYYIIRVNEFNKLAKTPLEEWLDYLKNGHIKDDTTTPGLSQAREKLQYLTMSEAERRAYDAHLDNVMLQNDVLDTAKAEGFVEGREAGRAKGLAEGRAEGRAEGLAEGRAEEKMENARQLKVNGVPVDIICKSLGLDKAIVESL